MVEQDKKVFDFKRLEEVTGGDSEFEQELLIEFLEDTPQVVGRMDEAVSRGDLDSVASESHGLKGSSLSLGADALGHLASKVESAAREGNATGVEPLVRELEHAFDAVRTAIQARIQRAA